MYNRLLYHLMLVPLTRRFTSSYLHDHRRAHIATHNEHWSLQWLLTIRISPVKKALSLFLSITKNLWSVSQCQHCIKFHTKSSKLAGKPAVCSFFITCHKLQQISAALGLLHSVFHLLNQHSSSYSPPFLLSLTLPSISFSSLHQKEGGYKYLVAWRRLISRGISN